MSDIQNPKLPANTPDDDDLSVEELDAVSGGGEFQDSDSVSPTINNDDCGCTNYGC